MAKIKVTIEFDVDEATTEAVDNNPKLVAYLLADAVGEFRDARAPAELYVSKRYASMDDRFRQRKLATVKTRNVLAAAMHNGLLGARIQRADACDCGTVGRLHESHCSSLG